MKKSSRRQFIKGAVGGLGGVIIGHTAKFFPETQTVWADKGSFSPSTIPLAQVEVGELYEGFLLLPENASCPIGCNYRCWEHQLCVAVKRHIWMP